jgi:hypothetical protein
MQNVRGAGSDPELIAVALVDPPADHLLYLKTLRATARVPEPRVIVRVVAQENIAQGNIAMTLTKPWAKVPEVHTHRTRNPRLLVIPSIPPRRSLLKGHRWIAKDGCDRGVIAGQLLQTTSTPSTFSQLRQVLDLAMRRLAWDSPSTLQVSQSRHALLQVATTVRCHHRCLPSLQPILLQSPTLPHRTRLPSTPAPFSL